MRSSTRQWLRPTLMSSLQANVPVFAIVNCIMDTRDDNVGLTLSANSSL
jgi:hypothetical protein